MTTMLMVKNTRARIVMIMMMTMMLMKSTWAGIMMSMVMLIMMMTMGLRPRIMMTMMKSTWARMPRIKRVEAPPRKLLVVPELNWALVK